MAQPRNFIPLEAVKIATPCRADWNRMQGSDNVRFCQTCTKNVYNLSDMTREQAEALILEKEGNLCVRFYQRADGTVLTHDCPVGSKVARRPFYWLAAGFAAFLSSGVAIAQHENTRAISPCPVTPPTYTASVDRLASFRGMPVIGAVVNKLSPSLVSAPPPPNVIMGAVAIPRPPARPTPTPAPTPTPHAEGG